MNARSAANQAPDQDEDAPLEGELYLTVLARLHYFLRPSTYLEIGTLTGDTLKIAACRSIAIDPAFQISSDVLGSKPSCSFFQATSDRFFRDHSPSAIFGAPIDFAFLDGMHLYEFLLRDFINTERHCAPNSVIAIHDCVPQDRWIAQRAQTEEISQRSQQPGWWTGDVWKCILALKKHRPDLRVMLLDAFPTGLALITNLDPKNDVLANNYSRIVDEFIDIDLGDYGVRKYRNDCGIMSTKRLTSAEEVWRYFWL